MGTSADSEEPDEIQHNAAFHQGLHYLLLDKNDLQGKKYNYILKLLPVPRGGSLIFSHKRRLALFFGVQISEFQYFWGFSEK